MNEDNHIIQLEGLRVAFKDRHSSATALREVSFTAKRGKTLALVGESGSGKSVTSLALMGLLPTNAVVRRRKWISSPYRDKRHWI